MSETLQGHRTKFKKERKANKTTESPTVSSRGQTTVILRSRSPSHCQTSTGKVQTSARGGTSKSANLRQRHNLNQK